METSALPLEKTNGSVPSPPKVNGNAISTTPSPTFTPKLSPFQIVILAAYPITVLLGILSNYPQDSYFSRKDNFINIVFLKFTWGWTSLAFFLHLARVPQKVAPLARYATATIWWTLVTQWAFGAPIMDKVNPLLAY
jgi:hypothetical protein